MSLRTCRHLLLFIGALAVLYAFWMGGSIGALLLIGGWFLGWATGLVMRQELSRPAEAPTPSALSLSSVVRDAFDPDKAYIVYDDGEMWVANDFTTAARPNWQRIDILPPTARK